MNDDRADALWVDGNYSLEQDAIWISSLPHLVRLCFQLFIIGHAFRNQVLLANVIIIET